MDKEKLIDMGKVLEKILTVSPEEIAATENSVDRMLEFSDKLIDVVTDFADNSMDDPGWATSMMMGLARATSVAVHGLEKVSGDPEANYMRDYLSHIFPLCDMVTQRSLNESEVIETDVDIN